MVTIGISDFAQDALGDIVFVEVPEVGRQVTAGEAIAEVESTKSVSDVYAPVSGTVVEVNTALEDNPELVNTDPFGEGWFAVIEATDLSELDRLMDVATYRESAQ
jgi:glycine cleavage system H protein